MRGALMAGAALVLSGFAIPSLIAGGGEAWAGGNGPQVLAPVPLEPGMIATPAAPMPAIEALPAPDLPQRGSPSPGPAVITPMTPGSGADPPATDYSGANSRPPAAGALAAAGAPVQVKPVWHRRTTAVVDVLDKEDGAVARIKVPVGTAVTQGKLRVRVGACLVRPKTMAPDAALYITVQALPTAQPAGPSTRGAPVFRGWLIRSEPGATVVGDAAVTFRLIGCTG